MVMVLVGGKENGSKGRSAVEIGVVGRKRGEDEKRREEMKGRWSFAVEAIEAEWRTEEDR